MKLLRYKLKILFTTFFLLSVSVFLNGQMITKKQQYLVVNVINNYCNRLKDLSEGKIAARFVIDEMFETPENSVYNILGDGLMPLNEFLDQFATERWNISLISEPQINYLYYYTTRVTRFGESKEILCLVLKHSIKVDNGIKNICFIVNTANMKLVNIGRDLPQGGSG